jgi:ADP-ribose pyrophosphatase
MCLSGFGHLAHAWLGLAIVKTICEGKRVLLIERDGWEFVERKKAKEAVAVLAMTKDGKVILTEQFRHPVIATVIDWPAGLVGDEDGHTDPAETAKKELEEETGYTCGSVELLARGCSSPGITSEVVSYYRANDVERNGEGGGVGGEDIKVHTVKLDAIYEWLREQERSGKMLDLKLWGGLYWLTK